MNKTLRMLLIGCLIACGIALVALGFVELGEDLMAPTTLILVVPVASIYLLPSWLAIYRDCKAAIWIALVNVLMGWTMFGWFVVLGWAASAKVREPAHAIGTPPHPVAGF